MTKQREAILVTPYDIQEVLDDHKDWDLVAPTTLEGNNLTLLIFERDPLVVGAQEQGSRYEARIMWVAEELRHTIDNELERWTLAQKIIDRLDAESVLRGEDVLG